MLPRSGRLPVDLENILNSGTAEVEKQDKKEAKKKKAKNKTVRV